MSFCKMSALIFFILATSVAAYNEVPTKPEDGNDLDSWPSTLEDEMETDTYWRRNLLLYKLLKKLQGDLDRRKAEDDLNIEQNWSQLPDLKKADEKKWVTALSTGKSSKTPKPRPQPKWKTKKGKGTPMLCYFKLCSFRSPI